MSIDRRWSPGAWRKLMRYISLHGVSKTLFKVAGRTRPRRFRLPGLRAPRDVGVVGCGQFAFATVGHVLWSERGKPFSQCFDPDEDARNSFARFFGCTPADSAEAVIRDPGTSVVYVTSNHSTHSDYAAAALRAGKATYIEKPVSLTIQQFARLTQGITEVGAPPVYAGYNRPFSSAIRTLRSHLSDVDSEEPFTLSCFVVGHDIPEGHWYRDPNEGTRICGNLGHWIDLAVHLASVRSLPDAWSISVQSSDSAATDDNLAVSLASEGGDLVNLVMTSRSEPFEGINESINFQCGDLMAKIDDFRSMQIWRGDRTWRLGFRPKDVGHHEAILQPFRTEARAWSEIEASTLLMFAIRDAVVDGRTHAAFSLSDWKRRLSERVAALNMSEEEKRD